MSRLKGIDYSNQAVYITANTYRRLPILINEPGINLLYESLDRAYLKYEFKINGYVIMPDHIHFILVSSNNDLSEMMHNIKGYFAHNMYKKKLFQSHNPIWQRSFYDHVIRNAKDLVEKLNYIHSNPLRAGLIKEIVEYKHSSFKYYYDIEDKLPVWFQKIGVI